MASALSGTESYTSALDSDRDDSDRDDENERASYGLLGDDQCLVLLATIGVHEAQEGGSCSSSSRCDAELEFGDRTLRSWHFDDQDRGAGRHGDVGFARGEVVLGDPSQTARQRHGGASLEVQLCRLGARLEVCLR